MPMKTKHGKFRVLCTDIGLALRNEYVHIVFHHQNPYYEQVVDLLQIEEEGEEIMGGLALKLDIDTDDLMENTLYLLMAYIDYADEVKDVS